MRFAAWMRGRVRHRAIAAITGRVDILKLSQLILRRLLPRRTRGRNSARLCHARSITLHSLNKQLAQARARL